MVFCLPRVSVNILYNFLFQGIGPQCPLHIDSANNDLTGRLIISNQIKELIIQLHNEVRSSLFDGTDIPRPNCLAGL